MYLPGPDPVKKIVLKTLGAITFGAKYGYWLNLR